jgi:FkbM family methyltransferase
MTQHSGMVSRVIKASPLGDGTAFERRRKGIRAILTQADRLVIFGAGQNGQMVASLLRRNGLEASAFMDDTPGKLNTVVSGLRVEAVPSSRPDQSTMVICSIFSAQYGFLPIQQRFQSLSIGIISLFELLWCLDDDALPFYFLDRPSVILDNLAHIDWLAGQLADEASQRELLSHVNFRLGLDHSLLPRPRARRIGPPPGWNHVTYIDGGAYDGDTLLQFVDAFGESLSQGIGLEPDSANFELLRARVAAAPKRVRTKMKIVNAALGAGPGLARFAGGRLQGSAISKDGDLTVQTISVDDLLKDYETSEVYVKFDIEGAEHDAIIGSRMLISSCAPVMAISLYHRPRDLWELPELVHRFNPHYQFFLRSHGEDGADLTAYACHRSLGGDFPIGLNSR